MATDTKSPGEKLSVTSKTTLTLKPRAETGVVRQSFSHGRSKAVVVEKVRKRTLGPGETKPAEPAPAALRRRTTRAPPGRRRPSGLHCPDLYELSVVVGGNSCPARVSYGPQSHGRDFSGSRLGSLRGTQEGGVCAWLAL